MSKRKTKKDDAPVEETTEEPAKKRSKPQVKSKEEARTEPYVDNKGWNIHPPSLIYKSWKAKSGAKIAAFDLDGTLVHTKSKAQFPRSADDWKWFNKKVVQTVKDFVEDGFQIVIFSNQGGIKSKLEGPMADKVKDRVEQVVDKLGVPAVALLATQTGEDDEYRKPATGMWKFFTDNLNKGKSIDMKKSFFVGDAAGRENDFAASDKEFAAAIKLPFKTPEDVFGESDAKVVLKKSAEASSYDSVNEELVTVFVKLADLNRREGNKFPAIAYKKAADVLAAFPKKIEESTLPEVKKLQGVGKGSIAVIQEWLSTGTVAALGESGEEIAAAAKESKQTAAVDNKVAMKFM